MLRLPRGGGGTRDKGVPGLSAQTLGGVDRQRVAFVFGGCDARTALLGGHWEKR